MSKRRRIGGYVDVRALGAEGFTDLFSAEHPATAEPVLLRVCRAAEPTTAERFRAEAARAAALRHEHIVPVLEVGSHRGEVFVAEPASANGSLATLLEKGPLPPHAARLELLRQVAAALAHAHAQGMTHHDLKPSRVHLLAEGGARLAGFGTGKLLTAHARLAGGDDALPEAGYLAPEIVEGRPPESSSDVFCFGLLAYELLTAQRAFPAATLTDLCRQLAGCDPVPVGELWAECPPDVAACVGRCLRRDPRERFSDFDEVVAALAEARAAFARRREVAPAPARQIDDRTTIAMPVPPGEQPAPPAPPATAGAADAPTVELTPEQKSRPAAPEEAFAAPAGRSAKALAAAGSALRELRRRAAAQLARGLALLGAVPRRGWLAAAGVLVGLLALAGLVSLARRPAPAERPAAPQDATLEPTAAPSTSAGRLLLDATPWAELTRLLDAAGRELPLPAERRTPLVLELEPGSYQAFLASPGSKEEASCSVEVALEGTARCLIDAGRLTVNDYFKSLGWWR